MFILMAESHCYMVETTQHFKSINLYLKINFKKSHHWLPGTKVGRNDGIRESGSWLRWLRQIFCISIEEVRTGHVTTDWFQIGKGICQGCILSPCLFDLDAEYIMRNAGLDESQAGIKIAWRKNNNLRYADDTTLMAERRRTKEPLDESERGEWKS